MSWHYWQMIWFGLYIEPHQISTVMTYLRKIQTVSPHNSRSSTGVQLVYWIVYIVEIVRAGNIYCVVWMNENSQKSYMHMKVVEKCQINSNTCSTSPCHWQKQTIYAETCTKIRCLTTNWKKIGRRCVNKRVCFYMEVETIGLVEAITSWVIGKLWKWCGTNTK